MPFASLVDKDETKALERRMKERSAINNLDAPTKKESRKLVKELSLRLQMAKEKLEDGTKNVNKMGLIQTSLASDKTVKENSVKVMAETVDEINEIQKVCALAVAEGSGVASGFQEGKCSFTLSEKERKEVKKVKEERKKKKKKKSKKKEEEKPVYSYRGRGRGGGAGGALTCYNCGKNGHISRFCPGSANVGKRKRDDSSDSDTDDSGEES